MQAAPEQLNIIIVNDFLAVNGGASKIAVTEAVGLAKSGHAVTFFCAVDGAADELFAAGVKVVSLHQCDILNDPNRFRAAAQGLWNRKAAREFARLLGSHDRATTIIHLHSWTKALSSSIVATAGGMGFKVVCTMHDYFLACPNGGFFNYTRGEICSLPAMSLGCLLTDCDSRSYLQKCWRLARQVAQKHFGKLPGGVADFIAVSRFSRAILQSCLPEQATVHLLDNPVAVDKTPPVDVATNERLVYIGRLAAEKGCLLFADALSRMAVPSCFIGDGELRAQVMRLAPGSTVTGWLQHDALLAAMQSARALVFPSLLFETDGLVVAEALARGIPVIVADTSAAREMVADGVTGLWFRGGDAGDLTRAMQQLASPGMAERMGRAAYDAYWSAPRTVERHIKELALCYAGILEKRQGTQ